jgi:hypothetical protein
MLGEYRVQGACVGHLNITTATEALIHGSGSQAEHHVGTANQTITGKEGTTAWSCGEKQLLQLCHVWSKCLLAPKMGWDAPAFPGCLGAGANAPALQSAAFLFVCCVSFSEDGNIRIDQLGIWDDCLTLVAS